MCEDGKMKQIPKEKAVLYYCGNRTLKICKRECLIGRIDPICILSHTLDFVLSEQKKEIRDWIFKTYKDEQYLRDFDKRFGK